MAARGLLPCALLTALTMAAGGCAPGKPTTPGVPSGRPAPARPAASGPKVPADALAKAVAGRATRAVDAKLPAATLIGKVRLVSDQGGAILSNNGGNILSNNGGNIVSDNGGGIISDQGGSLVGKTRYGVKQAQAAKPEAMLADAVVTVHDAAGRMLTLPDGTPIAAITDKTGAYKLQAPLPAENVVLRVRLWTGGELAAMAPKQAGGQREQAIDTASSLGAAYVLDRFVASQPDPQKTYDKLPASEAAALRDVIEAARGQLGATPKYEPAELVGLADGLQAKAPPVAKKLAEIKALLIGQAALGDGRRATEVALPGPSTMYVDRRGHVLMGEEALGRIRDLAPDGTLSTFADLQRGTRIKRNFFGLQVIAEAPDGTLFLGAGAFIYRVGADGQATAYAGRDMTSERRSVIGEAGVPAAELSFSPEAIVVGADGTLYVLDDMFDFDGRGELPRYLAIAPDGVVRELTAALAPGDYPLDLAADRDGRLLGLVRNGTGLVVRRFRPGEAPSEVATVPGTLGGLGAGPDGTAYVAVEGGQLYVIPPGGAAAPVDLAGGPSRPRKPVVAPDGTLYVADDATFQVFARPAGGAWQAVAGTAGAVRQDGATTAISLNRPAGLAFDDRGRLLFTESGGSALKRFDGTAVEVVAGMGPAAAGEGDGGPAAAARFLGPTGVAFHQGSTWVLDASHGRVRRIAPDGGVTTVFGRTPPHGQRAQSAGLVTALKAGQRLAPDQVHLLGGRGLAIGPDGLPYVAMARSGQVWRLAKDGMVELVAGLVDDPGRNEPTTRLAAGLPVDGMPAAEAALVQPNALAFGPEGDLYVADMFACRVWRITGLAGDRPTIHVFAGLPLPELLLRAGQGVPSWEGLAAAAVPLVLPCGLAFDATGRALVSAIGPEKLAALGPALGTAGFSTAGLPTVGSSVSLVGRDGVIHPLVGPFGRHLAGPDEPEPLIAPMGLAVAADGRLAIADAGANLIRLFPPGAF